MRSRFLYLVGVLVLGVLTQGFIASSENPADLDSIRSWPPDVTPYTRPAVPEDFAPSGVRATLPLPAAAPPGGGAPDFAPSGVGATLPLPRGFIVDVVVN